MPRLGIVTVGQAPRSDITPIFTEMLGDQVTLVEKGALDGMSPAELAHMAPDGEERRLATRLADGSQIVTSHHKTEPLVQKRINELNREGVDLILLLCTGSFHRFDSRVLVLESQKIVDHALEGVLNEERALGVFVPLAEQANGMETNLAHITLRVAAISASPYQDAAQLEEAARKMAQHKPDLIVLHCMGYTNEHRKIVNRVINKPSVLANSIVARTAAELLSGLSGP